MTVADCQVSLGRKKSGSFKHCGPRDVHIQRNCHVAVSLVGYNVRVYEEINRLSVKITAMDGI
jgi:hypothetical protein